MDNGWDASADAWIASLGEHGDFGRRYVLDPVMLARATARAPRTALDVGCGEGRFCRMLARQGIETTGVEPAQTLLEAARRRDPRGVYLEASAELLPLGDASFDLVVSYLTLIDIDDYQAAIQEMARVLAPGGALLIASLNGFNTACADQGWVHDAEGRRQHYPVDRYLEDRAVWVEWAGVRVINHHRPMRAYMQALLATGLTLTWFDEPRPTPEAPPSRAASYARVPWFHVMEWVKPHARP